MTTRILLADDHKIVRDGLRSMLANEAGMEVIAEAKNGQEAIDIAFADQPDVIIMDVSMPDLNGIEATKKIVKEIPKIKIIGLSMHSDKRFVTEMLRVGAMGYLLKDCAFEELSRAIRTVMSDQTYLSPDIAGLLVDNYVRGSVIDGANGKPRLTQREQEVLRLIAEGNTTKQTAHCMHVSVKTVETHRRQIMKKLETQSIADLTKFAIREGLVSLEH